MTANEEILTVAIERLAPGGDGVGHIDGKVCFVPLSAPGDRLLVRTVEEKSRFLKAEIASVIAAGPGRREPPCPLFGTCGGCSWLHLAEAQQVQSKRDILSKALDFPAIPFFISPQALGYRSVARLHAAPAGSDSQTAVGFTHRMSHDVVPVAHCPILAPAINRCLLDIASDLLASIRHPVEIRLALGHGGPSVVVTSSRPMPEPFYRRAAALSGGSLAGVGLVVEGISSHVAGTPEVHGTGVDGAPFSAPPLSFGQANPSVNQMIADTTAAWIAPLGIITALELFAGAANLSAALAPLAQAYAVSDIDQQACRAAEKNLWSRGLGRVRLHPGDALEVYRGLGRAADLVVLDPPRRGHRELARALGQGRHRAILYVSCDPSTLSRDLEEITAGGYRLTKAAGFDMFPQTAHMEAAVLLERTYGS